MAKKGRRREKGKAGPESKASPHALSVVVEEQPTPDARSRAEPYASHQAGHGLSNVIISIALLYQVVMPLRYYLGGGGADERFSWRMFSTVRMQKCSVTVDEQVDESGTLEQRPVDLTQAFQIAWMGMLERNRPQVVDKVLQRRCLGTHVREAHYRRSCVDTDGAMLPTLDVTFHCASGEVSKQTGTP